MKQNNSPSEHISKISVLFSLLLLLIFLISTIFLVLIGSQVYENIRQRNSVSFYSYTASNYIANKVRQMDAKDCIELRTENNCQILVLKAEQNNEIYETWIYAKDGQLMELYTPKESGLTLQDGIPLFPCNNLTFSLNQQKHLLTITLKQQKNEPVYTINLLLRSSY